jgi:hypothetical protein
MRVPGGLFPHRPCRWSGALLPARRTIASRRPHRGLRSSLKLKVAAGIRRALLVGALGGQGGTEPPGTGTRGVGQLSEIGVKRAGSRCVARRGARWPRRNRAPGTGARGVGQLSEIGVKRAGSRCVARRGARWPRRNRAPRYWCSGRRPTFRNRRQARRQQVRCSSGR